jgi:hypothetical protein
LALCSLLALDGVPPLSILSSRPTALVVASRVLHVEAEALHFHLTLPLASAPVNPASGSARTRRSHHRHPFHKIQVAATISSPLGLPSARSRACSFYQITLHWRTCRQPWLRAMDEDLLTPGGPVLRYTFGVGFLLFVLSILGDLGRGHMM